MTESRPAVASVAADGGLRQGLRRVYLAEAAAGVGEGVLWIALVTFLAEFDAFAALLTVAVVARLAPRALLGWLVGPLLQRVDVRRALVVVDGLRTLLLLAAAGMAASGSGPGPVLLLVLVSHVVGVPTKPAVSAVLPRVAGEAELSRAAARLSTVRQLGSFLGPLAGVAVVALSPAAGFLLNAATFLVGALLYASVRGHGWSHAGGGASRRDATHRRAWRTAGRPALLALVAGVYAVRGAELVLHVLVVRDLLGVDVSAIGYLNGAIGFGVLLTAPLLSRLADLGAPGRSLLASVVLTAVPTTALLLVGSVAGASALLVVVGAAMVVFETVSVVVLQRTAEEHELAEVFSATAAVGQTAKLVGAAVTPAAVALVGLRGTLVGLGVLVLLVAGVAAPAVLRLGRRAADRRAGLAPTVDALQRCPLFAPAPSSALERLAGAVEQRPVRRGDVVVRQGEPAQDLFLVRAGDLEVTVDGERVRVLGAGGWFGEIGLVDGVARTATVRALERGLLWRVPGTLFLEALGATGAAPDELTAGIRARRAAGAGAEAGAGATTRG